MKHLLQEGLQIWFVTGSQHLYGEETLIKVKAHTEAIVKGLTNESEIAVDIVGKSVMTNTSDIVSLCHQANAADCCVGLILWMHTFSPAKMWINGLKILQKPMLHLHTQYNRDIPWSTIDMDFMNLNQTAHGGREFGFLNAVMGTRRKVVVGHWTDDHVIQQISSWSRVARGWQMMQCMKVVRFGDNMREVAVTEGNKVSAQIQFGFSVDGFGLGDLVNRVESIEEKDVDHLVDEYQDIYHLAGELRKGKEKHSSLRDAAKIELGLRRFLEEGEFSAFTTTFENLHGLHQLPGIAVQRLMADGYGFGAEGDWKTAALLRTMKLMSSGLSGGTSFMEDYTYHFAPGNKLVLGAHMLEICPSIAGSKPSCEIHPLSIGGKKDPVRLVFNSRPGRALNVALIDLGHRFRLLVNTVEVVEEEMNMPNLPVARALWKPEPSLATAAAAWILAGGAHHTCFSQALSVASMEDFSEMAGIELIVIDEGADLRGIKNELRWNEGSY
ncbi:MAG: L-arabinose isomerase [Saprospiraceae bacterium]|nr:L-arabinose isomerase [Saprospiraceae bacterium]